MVDSNNFRQAPAWQISQWFNTKTDLSLEQLRGKVIVLHAFQMLCRGCVHNSLPQLQRIFSFFPTSKVAVIALHTVFEHHEATQPVSLKAFLFENRYTFPVGIDKHDVDKTTPLTMRAYQMQGTPTHIFIDREGRIRSHTFGTEDDLKIGAEIAMLLN